MDWKHVAILPEKEQMRAWVENWKRVGPELERIKKEELRAMTDEEGTRKALLLMSRAAVDQWIDPRRIAYSGLIEQQRIFAKAARPSK